MDNNDTIEHVKKVRIDNRRGDINKFSFPQRCVEVWNCLDKRIIEARTIHKLKEMLNLHGDGDRTIQV